MENINVPEIVEIYIKANGYLYGEEMCEYRDLEKELGPSLSLTNKKNF